MLLTGHCRPGRMGIAAGLFLMVTTAVGLQSATAADPAQFYRGETIRLAVGYAPGGGFDTLARLLAPRLEANTGATVVVENRPGGGGLVALNQVVGATPDGLTIMLVNGQAAALAQLLDMEGVRFDLLTIPWLARVASDPSVVLVGQKSPYRSIRDMQQARRPVKWAGGGKADTMTDTAACLSEALRLDARTIIGYKGSKEAALSTMRGETDAIITTAASARTYAKSGRLTPLTVLSRQRSAQLPETPTIFEVCELNDRQAWWIDFRAGIALIGRALMTTPGTPDERVAFLASATSAILEDEDFINDAQAKGHIIEWADAGQLRSLLDTTLGGLQGRQLEQVRTVILEKYYR